MTEKLITFVVPCYNSQDYMKKCLDSLIPAGECAEILIINDGSNDRTGEIASSFEKRYPHICRVITQQNGGHGAGINHGLREAGGRYFKVVDSDDWVDEPSLIRLLAALNDLEKDGGADILFVNYIYDNVDPSLTKTVSFSNVFPTGHIFDWNEVGRFRLWQYLFMHACIHRTELLRGCGLVLPEHTFYEDELFSYYPLPQAHRLYYLDADFYHYRIGRTGQSVEEDIMAQRYEHQIRISCGISVFP
ncbi:MAG: glycosyltransferase [Clostridiales bacterium]|nr:glycosyltransferase [Clostridiales bacterium]